MLATRLLAIPFILLVTGISQAADKVEWTRGLVIHRGGEVFSRRGRRGGVVFAALGGHEARSRGTDVLRSNGARVAHAPGCRQGMAGEQADPFLDITEPFGGLSFPTPFDFAGVDIDSP